VKRPILAGVACATLVLTAAVAAPASAHGNDDRPPITVGDPVTVAEGLLTPLSLEVGGRVSAYVSQDFAGLLTAVGRDGALTTIASATEEGNGIGAVSRYGRVYYAEVSQDHTYSMLKRVTQDADGRDVADIALHEATANPDKVNTYGFAGINEDDPECAALIDPAAPPFVEAEYIGQIDTNPFSTLATRRGVYIADAGGNAILKADYDGTISTVAVLPPDGPYEVTAEIAEQVGFPDCVVGRDYYFEPVPTDVEQGPNGWLYVTSLPGGPEDPSLGARGSVYKVSPHDGTVKLVAKGFGGATGLAVSRDSGTVYVAELFGGEDATGQISVVRPHSDTPTPLVSVSSPTAIELRRGKLWVTTDSVVFNEEGIPQPVGKITTFELSGQGGKGSHDIRDFQSHSSNDASTSAE
jgi:hypothetical protein